MQVPVGKYDNRQHAFSHHEVAADVKQMHIRPIIVVVVVIVIVITVSLNTELNKQKIQGPVST